MPLTCHGRKDLSTDLSPVDHVLGRRVFGATPGGLPIQRVKRLGPTQIEGSGLALQALPHTSGLFLSAILFWREGKQTDLRVFIDSGAAGNFIDKGIVHSLELPLEALSHPLPVTALDGQPLASSPITT